MVSLVNVYKFQVDLFTFTKESLTTTSETSRGALKKRCSENIQQTYRRTPKAKCDFNKVELTPQHEFYPVNLLHIFRTPFLKNTSGRLLLKLHFL